MHARWDDLYAANPDLRREALEDLGRPPFPGEPQEAAAAMVAAGLSEPEVPLALLALAGVQQRAAAGIWPPGFGQVAVVRGALPQPDRWLVGFGSNASPDPAAVWTALTRALAATLRKGPPPAQERAASVLRFLALDGHLPYAAVGELGAVLEVTTQVVPDPHALDVLAATLRIAPIQTSNPGLWRRRLDGPAAEVAQLLLENEGSLPPRPLLPRGWLLLPPELADLAPRRVGRVCLDCRREAARPELLCPHCGSWRFAPESAGAGRPPAPLPAGPPPVWATWLKANRAAGPARR